MNYTSIEQSKKLLKLGLNPESADMYYFLDPTPAGNIYHLTVQRVDFGIKDLLEYKEGDIPCWSVGALLKVLPSAIESNGHYYCLKIGKLANEVDWYVYYEWEGWTYKIMKGELMDDAIFDMIVWLLENGYIKKGE